MTSLRFVWTVALIFAVGLAAPQMFSGETLTAVRWGCFGVLLVLCGVRLAQNYKARRGVKSKK
jgi:hypothetical protein